jgi:hypothetical protein
MSNSSRNMVNARRDSVMKNQSRSYRRYMKRLEGVYNETWETYLDLVGAERAKEDALHNVGYEQGKKHGEVGQDLRKSE